MLFGILGAFVWFLLFVLLKWGYFHRYRILDRGKLATRMFLGCVVGNALSTWTLISGAGDLTLSLHAELCGVTVMACLFVVYMPFYYTIATSLSVQTLSLLSKSGGTLTVDELILRFGSKEFVADRLRTMVRNGYLTQVGNAFFPSRKGRVLARVFSSVKTIWRLGAGG